ncbi:hypothetical protein JHS3_06540 [Jeongeupia sp. HS-3]|uniref:type II secretion system protein N n=1 Tax=Jeongeupia sp. HS-3 TaxID=1009682 RepID=UPI0018A657E9|nr:type II secretion system protein N [Jeongeupia sp. HS-3]BCL74918.1 hypothetical protein JHS3_06540 [Jeongeupia sp. HS-3]
MLRVFALNRHRLTLAGVIPVMELGLVLLIAWLAAGFFWQLFAPRSTAPSLTPPLPPPPARVRAWNGASSWFGVSGANEAAASTLSARLVAVIAGDDRSSAAIFTGIEASAVALRVGQSLQPGVQLVRVARDRVELDRQGKREVLMLDGRDASEPGVSGSAPTSRSAPGAAPAIDVPVATLFRGQLAATMQAGNIADWAKGLAPSPGGGILIADPAQQPLAKSLQLQAGDVLKAVNGQNLSQPADMSLVFTAFSQQAQIRLSVLRGGVPTTLQYQIQP